MLARECESIGRADIDHGRREGVDEESTVPNGVREDVVPEVDRDVTGKRVNELRFEHVDAGVDQQTPRSPKSLLDETEYAPARVDFDNALPVCGRCFVNGESSKRVAASVCSDERSERLVHQDVAVEHEERRR